MAMTIARPTVASAAATAMTISAMTEPLAPSAGLNGAERDDREVDGVEHQLDRHQHADRVAPGEEAERPDREEEPGQDQVGVERVAHGWPARLALGEEDAADHRREQQHADDLERQDELVEQRRGDGARS